jgi:hypothetical protein
VPAFQSSVKNFALGVFGRGTPCQLDGPYQFGSLYEIEQLGVRTTGEISTETF